MAIGDNEQARIEFIRSAINAHRESHAYKTAADAEEYYNGLNPTINRYEKIIYDMQGRAHETGRNLVCRLLLEKKKKQQKKKKKNNKKKKKKKKKQ